MFKFLLLVNIILSPKDHLEFEELYLGDDIKLIEEISESSLTDYYNKISDKFWGWNSYLITDNELVEYTSPCVFSYSNDGESEYKYDYSSTQNKTIKGSVSVKGDISIKGEKTISKLATKLGVNINASVKGDYSQSESVKEVYSLKVEIPPHTKVSLKKQGTARLTNGVSKMFVGFLEVHKGSWEVIEPITETSWFLEEYI